MQSSTCPVWDVLRSPQVESSHGATAGAVLITINMLARRWLSIDVELCHSDNMPTK